MPIERDAGDILKFEMVKVQNITRSLRHNIEHSLITQFKDLRFIGAFLRFAVAGSLGLNSNFLQVDASTPFKK